MAAISLAVIGKNNEPLYIREFNNTSDAPKPSSFDERELFGLTSTLPVDQSSTLSISVPDSEVRTTASSAVNEQARTQCSLRQQFILHAALDRFDQLAGPNPGFAWRTPGVSGTDAMWVGLLCPIEDMRVYGYMTTTQIKFLLTVEDDDTTVVGDQQRTVDETIKQLLVKLHRLYVEYTLNPFSPLAGGPIESLRFDTKVGDCIMAYNRMLH